MCFSFQNRVKIPGDMRSGCRPDAAGVVNDGEEELYRDMRRVLVSLGPTTDEWIEINAHPAFGMASNSNI
ncbi:hypothetical protein L249_6482 [Ophiocordyceps polyrhachis-furcata BCC 54312]|uniref:Uncharacterized protein n=1 Tax=Ophiocordyceps polyrhachis-furcata BCC 54312 TaxID=1330021 RepID=A0A367LLH5_9HYPO|nr:hypothetical protein L249_6482 [Ophiocordyceps polyrhachis-furcata BCC 54312]